MSRFKITASSVDYNYFFEQVQMEITNESVITVAEAAATVQFAWFESLSAEDKQKHLGDQARWYDDAERPAIMEEYNVIFAAADANGDGRLDKAELKAWMAGLTADKISRGIPVFDSSNMTDEKLDELYACFNAISDEGEGVSKPECMAWGGVFMKKFT